MRHDVLRARLLADLAELADLLKDHPAPQYAELGTDLRALRERLRTLGHVEVTEPKES